MATTSRDPDAATTFVDADLYNEKSKAVEELEKQLADEKQSSAGLVANIKVHEFLQQLAEARLGTVQKQLEEEQGRHKEVSARLQKKRKQCGELTASLTELNRKTNMSQMTLDELRGLRDAATAQLDLRAKRLQDRVTCPVCLIPMAQVTLTSCQHPLCQTCMTGIALRAKDAPLKCPSCRSVMTPLLSLTYI